MERISPGNLGALCVLFSLCALRDLFRQILSMRKDVVGLGHTKIQLAGGIPFSHTYRYFRVYV